eukprot:713961-Lingulodinium_polyedra.AAC.1
MAYDASSRADFHAKFSENNRMDSEIVGPSVKGQLLCQGCAQLVQAACPVHGAWERLRGPGCGRPGGRDELKGHE